MSNYILPFNVLSSAELSPSEKLTLIGIDMTKAINEDGTIKVNLDRVKEYTHVSNRNIRRHLTTFVEQEILIPNHPDDIGKVRILHPQKRYGMLFNKQEEVVLDNMSSIKKQVTLDNLSSKELIDSIPKIKCEPIPLTQGVLCSNTFIINRFVDELVEGKCTNKWIPAVVEIDEKEFSIWVATITDPIDGSQKYIADSSIEIRLDDLKRQKGKQSK